MRTFSDTRVGEARGCEDGAAATAANAVTNATTTAATTAAAGIGAGAATATAAVSSKTLRWGGVSATATMGNSRSC